MADFKACDEGTKTETCEWLNLLLNRLWFEYTEKDSIQKFLQSKVEEELVDVKRTVAGVFLVSVQIRIYPFLERSQSH